MTNKTTKCINIDTDLAIAIDHHAIQNRRSFSAQLATIAQEWIDSKSNSTVPTPAQSAVLRRAELGIEEE
jgi:hypothetical protein